MYTSPLSGNIFDIIFILSKPIISWIPYIYEIFNMNTKILKLKNLVVFMKKGGKEIDDWV